MKDSLKNWSSKIEVPIRLERNDSWINPNTRLSCKYSPVVVSKKPTDDEIKVMQEVLKNRINICKELAKKRKQSDQVGWFSFIRGSRSHEPSLKSDNVPVIVISGGSAKKLAAELSKDYSLAWHPMNLRNEPLYLLVHSLDYDSYASALNEMIWQFRNMHLIGWNGGAMAGFGAALAAALAFADTLPYRPKRILMVDQDVVQTEDTRHTSPTVQNAIKRAHKETKKTVIGFGVGYPTRGELPKYPFKKSTSDPGTGYLIPREIPTFGKDDFNSPTQQFVSIEAPFRSKMNDGIYPAYMVGGGEDMLMGMQLELTQQDRNITLLEAKILKKELKGEVDTPNAYWNEARVEALRQLFEGEKDTLVTFDNESMSLDELMSYFVKQGWIKSHRSADSYNVSACIIERIILRLHKEGNFPVETINAVFNR